MGKRASLAKEEQDAALTFKLALHTDTKVWVANGFEDSVADYSLPTGWSQTIDIYIYIYIYIYQAHVLAMRDLVRLNIHVRRENKRKAGEGAALRCIWGKASRTAGGDARLFPERRACSHSQIS